METLSRFAPVIRMIKVIDGQVVNNPPELRSYFEMKDKKELARTLGLLDERLGSLESAFKTTSKLLQGQWAKDEVLMDALRTYKREMTQLKHARRVLLQVKYK
jgi:hypothetical protein